MPEWQVAMEQLTKLVEQHEPAAFRSLVLSDGGAPDSMQRQQIFVQLLKGESRSVAVTNALNNRIKRGIATAIGWINPSFRAVSPKNIGEAISYLDLEPHTASILACFKEMQSAGLPEIATLKEVEELLASS